jgi:hypothetical protein
MITEEYKGRSLEINNTDSGDPSVAGSRYAVRWLEEGKEEHGLCANEDLPGLIDCCKKAIDLYSKPKEKLKILGRATPDEIVENETLNLMRRVALGLPAIPDEELQRRYRELDAAIKERLHLRAEIRIAFTTNGNIAEDTRKLERTG